MSGINVLFNTANLNQSGSLDDLGALSFELGEYVEIDLSIFPSQPLSIIEGYSGNLSFLNKIKNVYTYNIHCDVLPIEISVSGLYPSFLTPYNIATLGFDRICHTEIEPVLFTGESVSSELDTLIPLNHDHFAGESVSSELDTLIPLNHDQFSGERVDADLDTLIPISHDHFAGSVFYADFYLSDSYTLETSTGSTLTFELIDQYIPSLPQDFVFFCPYDDEQHGGWHIVFPEPGCSLFNIISGEYTEINLKTFGLDTIEFDFYSGSELAINVSASSVFSYEHISGTHLGIELSQSVIFDLVADTGSELTFEIIKSDLIQIDYYEGSIFDLDLTVEFAQSLDFDSLSGQIVTFDLITTSISYGGSELEVININDSRRKVTVSLRFKGYEWQQSLLIESITFESIQVMSQFNKTIKLIPAITASLEKSSIKIISQIRNK